MNSIKTVIAALALATTVGLTGCTGTEDTAKADAAPASKSPAPSQTSTPTPTPTPTPTDPAKIDSDGDGTYDVDDVYPNDPTRTAKPWVFHAKDYEHSDVLTPLHKAGFDDFIQGAHDADASAINTCDTISGKKPGGGTERDERENWTSLLTSTDDGYGWTTARATRFVNTLFKTCRSTGNSEPYVPPMTASQEQAVGTAQDYLDSLSFSRSGLIEQLEYEDFSHADAVFAVDHITVDWMEQAVLKAKDYLDSMHFSHGGLVEQLEYEGFTREQAEHGARGAGL